jgi:hypothetical protein
VIDGRLTDDNKLIKGIQKVPLLCFLALRATEEIPQNINNCLVVEVLI